MGLSGGKKTTTSNQTATTTPNTPAFATFPVQNYYDQLGQFALNTQANGGGSQFVAPANDLQKQAYGGAQNLGGWQSLFDRSSGLANEVVASGAPRLDTATVGGLMENGGLDRYMSPYQQQVIDATLAGFDDQAGRDQAAYAAAGARNKAFGGSRFGVGEAQLTSDLARERAGTQAGLLDKGFQTAAGLAQFDVGQMNEHKRAQAALEDTALGRKLQAAGLFASNANSSAENARSDIASQIAAGNNMYAIDQAEAMAPLEWMQAYGSLLNPSVIGQYTGQTINSNGKSTEKSSGGLLGTLASIASIAGSFSDRRLKTAIERVGTLPDGLGVYEYEYVWGGGRQRGVMADEVAELRPWALGPEVAGFATVDYSKLEAA